MNPDAVMERFARALRGGPLSASAAAALDGDEIWYAATRHGVAPLLAERLAACDPLPVALRARVRQLTQDFVATDLWQEAALGECLSALDEAGHAALLMKGALLAYTHYPRPDLRPRLDTDILIRWEQRAAVDATLSRLGYTADVRASNELVLYQQTYVNRSGDGQAHVLDVHWRLSNPEVFRSVLTFDEMNASATSVSGLPAARGLSDVHALIVACVHRVAHHRDDERLIWLYDIHLLASRLDRAQWAKVAALAAERGVQSVCAAGLRRAQHFFGTSIPATFVAEPAASELTARYLQPRRSQVDAVVDDLRSLPAWTDRVRLVREYAFPPKRYMREVYAPATATPLLWLYLRRMVFGARRWLAH